MALSKIRNDSFADTAVHGRRNHIINGGFQCWQRSEDKENTGTGWGYWAADRFFSNKGRFRKTTDTVDGRTVNVLRVDPSSGVYNGGRGVLTRIEDYNVYDKPTTISVWVKADAATTVKIGLIWVSGDTSADESGTTVNVTTSWQKFTYNIPAKSYTQAADQYIIADLVDGRTYYVAMAQLEDGDTATTFEHRSLGDELSACQRYFCKSYDDDDAPGYAAQLGAIYDRTEGGVSNRCVSVQYPATMRANPTITLYSLNGTSGSVSDCNTGYSHSSNDAASISGTVGRTGFSKLSGIASSNSAILGFHFTADAEL